MNFSTDRDLLALEPTLFHDVPWVGQQRINVDDAYITGQTVSSDSADFVAAQVEAGSVVLIDKVAHEVIAVSAADTLTISRLRTRLADLPIPGEDGGPFTLSARTFAPQAELVHDGLLRLLGIDPNDDAADALTEDAVVSISVMARLDAGTRVQRRVGADRRQPDADL